MKLTKNQLNVFWRASGHANVSGNGQAIHFNGNEIEIATEPTPYDGYNWHLVLDKETKTAYGRCGYGSSQEWRYTDNFLEIKAVTCGGHWVYLKIGSDGSVEVDCDDLWSGENWSDCGENRSTKKDYGESPAYVRSARRKNYLLTGSME